MNCKLLADGHEQWKLTRENDGCAVCNGQIHHSNEVSLHSHLSRKTSLCRVSTSNYGITLPSHFLRRGKETWVQLRSSKFQCCTRNSNCSRPPYKLQQTRNSWDVFCDNSGWICLLDCAQKEGKAHMKGNRRKRKE